ncbi:MAG TPA: hypothetical protein ENI61_04255 [Ignavibacteria bacterium]|nr:hypothetical protein [Ignavibacteria bacterium]
MKICTNKNDGSGELGNFTHTKNTITIYGCMGKPKEETFELKKVYKNIWKVTHKDFSYAICHVTGKHSFCAYNSVIERHHPNKYTAVYQVLINTL